MLCPTCSSPITYNESRVYRPKYCSQVCAKRAQWKGVHRPESLLDCSSRTVTKILKRIGKMRCSLCDWDKGTCDIHHIKGKKIDNPNHHSNLTLLCPNCHRLVHEKKITEVITLEEFLGDLWKEGYYGLWYMKVGSIPAYPTTS